MAKTQKELEKAIAKSNKRWEDNKYFNAGYQKNNVWRTTNRNLRRKKKDFDDGRYDSLA